MDLDLGLVFLIGLLGSAHCLGMCGGFVLALSGLHDRGTPWHVHQMLYALGKTATYTLFGALAGGVGAAVGQGLAGLQSALSVALGVFLIVVGLGIAGVLRRMGGAGRLARMDVVGRMLAYVLQRRARTASLGLGLVNGLLPCGLVYGLLIKAAATGTVAGGALTMAVFGLSTIPALYALALTGLLMRPVWRARLNVASGVLVVLLGVMTLVRGTPAMEILMGDAHAEHAPTVHEAIGDEATELHHGMAH